jgi:hypothetical protein
LLVQLAVVITLTVISKVEALWWVALSVLGVLVVAGAGSIIVVTAIIHQGLVSVYGELLLVLADEVWARGCYIITSDPRWGWVPVLFTLAGLSTAFHGIPAVIDTFTCSR